MKAWTSKGFGFWLKWKHHYRSKQLPRLKGIFVTSQRSYKTANSWRRCFVKIINVKSLQALIQSLISLSQSKTKGWIHQLLCLTNSRFDLCHFLPVSFGIELLVIHNACDWICDLCWQAAEPFFLLAGPNVIESEEHIMRMAKHIKSISTKWVHFISNHNLYLLLWKRTSMMTKNWIFNFWKIKAIENMGSAYFSWRRSGFLMWKFFGFTLSCYESLKFFYSFIFLMQCLILFCLNIE